MLFPYLSFIKQEYVSIFIFLIIAIILSGIILGLSFLLAVQNPDTEKLSAYECGFDPYDDARHTFDVRFYLVAMLFIIFDIEAMFLFPWSVSLMNTTTFGFWTIVDFIVELGVGYIYAWKIKALEWE
jgi:NADH-quinone oxidoreductase subunit A